MKIIDFDEIKHLVRYSPERSYKLFFEMRAYILKLESENKTQRELLSKCAGTMDGNDAPQYQLMNEIVAYFDDIHNGNKTI